MGLLTTLAVACSTTAPGATPATPGAGATGSEADAAAPLRAEGDMPFRPLHGLLPFFYDLYTFRDAGGRTRVVASFAVPAGSLEERRVGRRARYHFDVSLVLADTALGTVLRTDDSVVVATRRPLAGKHLLYTQVELLAPPSASTVHRVTMTDGTIPGIGQLYDATFPIPDYGGDALMVSDIALGQPDVRGGWKRGAVALALLPTSQFPESAFDVYYEVYNLPAGHRYTTEIAVEHLGAYAGGRGTRLRFEGESTAGPDGSIQELRRVDTALSRGRYRLTVTITDEATGRSARSSREFQVRGWIPGATLVPALPRGLRRPRESAGTSAGTVHQFPVLAHRPMAPGRKPARTRPLSRSTGGADDLGDRGVRQIQEGSDLTIAIPQEVEPPDNGSTGFDPGHAATTTSNAVERSARERRLQDGACGRRHVGPVWIRRFTGPHGSGPADRSEQRVAWRAPG